MDTFLSVRRWVAALFMALALLSGALIALAITARWYSAQATSTVPIFIAAANAQAQPIAGSFSGVLGRAMPAVASVSSSRIVRQQRRGRDAPPPGFMDPESRDFFGFRDDAPGFGVPRERREEGLGSAVIISPDGVLLTNNHVIEGATDIRITLADRREFRATLVGADPLSDVAVLRIDATNLPTLPLADSTQVQVGDLCLAIGNPFGIGQTATFGIVSATGRGLGIMDFEDFIQTDAAINPGNSGGALTNTRGELIGINTAILSRGAGNQGIGFAIPINMAREVMQQILRTGRVTRGYMGVGIQEVTPGLARALGMTDPQGVVVTEIEATGPAARSGLKTGDVILSVNGETIADLNSFRLKVSGMAPGTTIRLRIRRETGEQDVTVTLGELPTRRPETNDDPSGQPTGALEGVSVDNLSPQIARQLNLPARMQGVVVTNISPASEAFAAGLRRGDVIQEVNRQRVTNVRAFEQAVRQAGRESVLLLVNRGGRNVFVAIEQR
ncbi:MAG: DegQ family serine endoprotease [Bryobacteraceae bacterium]